MTKNKVFKIPILTVNFSSNKNPRNHQVWKEVRKWNKIWAIYRPENKTIWSNKNQCSFDKKKLTLKISCGVRFENQCDELELNKDEIEIIQISDVEPVLPEHF